MNHNMICNARLSLLIDRPFLPRLIGACARKIVISCFGATFVPAVATHHHVNGKLVALFDTFVTTTCTICEGSKCTFLLLLHFL